MKFELERATDGKHKWVGIFTSEAGDVFRQSFGYKGMEDYTQHHDKLRRASYLARHRTRENWEKPMTAGALSRWILWDSSSLQHNVRNFKRRFSLS